MLKIAITGKMRSGKDTLAGFFLEKGMRQYEFKAGIADIIKQYFPEAMIHGKPRRHYQHIGQSLRALNNDVWVNYTFNAIDRYCGLYPAIAEREGIIITDLRQPNEYTALKARGYTIIKVVCDDDERIARMKKAGDVFSPEDLNHETERNVDAIQADIVIDNTGTKKDLYIQFCKVWEQLQERAGQA